MRQAIVWTNDHDGQVTDAYMRHSASRCNTKPHYKNVLKELRIRNNLF